MFIPLIFKDANFHIYKINEKCEVMKNDELLSEDDYIYHSTNGYDYILLEKLDGILTMYPLDQVVYNSFYPDTQNIYEHFKCIHIDGNLRNNNLYNLESVNDVEEWKVVTYPGVKKDSYMISSYGNVWSKITGNMLSPIRRQNKNGHTYLFVKIKFGKSTSLDIHRLVAYEFISKNVINSGMVVNHIDNNGCNNNIINLEVLLNQENSQHAVLIGVQKGCIRSKELIETFCKIYVKNKGDIRKTTNDLKDAGIIEYFDQRRRSDLIRKRMWSDITDNYFKYGEFGFPKKDQLYDDEVIEICIELIKHKGSSKFTTEYLQNKGRRIMFNDVNKIRYKYCHTEISDKYFIIDENKKFVPLINI